MKVFITGVSSGVGRELTRQLVQEGHQVLGVARREELLKTLTQEVGAERFQGVACDLGNLDDIGRVKDLMTCQDFVPDAVVLNAAIDKGDVHPKYRQDVVRETIRTNLLGTLEWVDVFLESFLSRGHGQFIAISSLFAFRPDEDSVSYAASKAALAMAFRGLQLSYRNTPVRFKVMYFGPIATAINPRFEQTPPRGLKALFVAPVDAAAGAVIRAIGGKRHTYYFPLMSTWLVRLTAFLPDSVFAALSRTVRR